jgi:hypothetical protein
MKLKEWYRANEFAVKFFVTAGLITVLYVTAFILGWYQVFNKG